MKRPILLLLPSLKAGGAERVIVNLANNFALKQLSVYLVVLNGVGPLRDQIAPEVRVLELGVRHARYSILSLAALFRRVHPSAVLSTIGHLNLIVGLLRPFFPKIRFYCRESNFPSMKIKSERWPKLFSLLYRLVYPRFDSIICQSTSMMDDLENNYLKNRTRLRLIHNPVNIELVQKLSMLGDPYPVKYPIILAVGRFVSQKQFHLLPTLLKLVLARTKVKMHVLGDGPLLASVMAASKREGLDDEMTFWGVQDNPYRFMRHAKLLVLVSAHEGFPNVVLEANAVGIPAVAFRCPGVNEEIITDGQNGFLIEQGDLNAMANQIISVLNGESVLIKTSEWIASRFDIEHIASQYLDLLAPTSNEMGRLAH